MSIPPNKSLPPIGIGKFSSVARFTFYILLTASICSTGCAPTGFHPLEVFARHSDPIPGWQTAFNQKPSPAIEKDYHDFITKLPIELKQGLGPVQYLQDVTGQHAIKIETGKNGTDWIYVLIYDQSGKRTKVIKYIGGHYMS